MKLIENQPRRLFAFGCSFTQYKWLTWPEIVAYDLNIPMFNLGRAGAGNQYIVNAIAQANEVYNFNSKDLVMICWSGYMREDRWINNDWTAKGIVTNSPHYDQEFVDKYMDTEGVVVRDFAGFAMVKRLLDKLDCQHHMFSVYPMWQTEVGKEHAIDTNNNTVSKLREIYRKILLALLPSFTEVLWDSDIETFKTKQQSEIWNNKFTDWHPLIFEHFDYLKSVFDEHKFSEQTKHAVKNLNRAHWEHVNKTIAENNLEIYDPNIPSLESADCNRKFHLTHNNYRPSLLL